MIPGEPSVLSTVPLSPLPEGTEIEWVQGMSPPLAAGEDTVKHSYGNTSKGQAHRAALRAVDVARSKLEDMVLLSGAGTPEQAMWQPDITRLTAIGDRLRDVWRNAERE